MAVGVEQDLILQGVGKSYGNLQILQPTDLHVRTGEFLTIVGPSGSGKTTLLRMIAGFTEASCGIVRFQGQDMTRVPTHRRPFNTVFQDYALFPHMTVKENVGYGPMLRREPREQIARKTTEALSTVGLQELGDRMPSQLSGGQKQRVALARALVCEPQVLLLDEPLSALDAEMRHQMQVFLKDLQRRVATTFILVTHDQEEAITMSDRIAVMSAGRLEQIGTHREVYYAPKTRFVASFFGDNNLLDGFLTDDSLETPFGRFKYPGPRSLTRTPVMLALRPEAIRLGPAAAKHGAFSKAGLVTIQAKVRQANFAGPMTRVIASPEGRPNILLMIKVNSALTGESLNPGDKVGLAFAMRDLAVLSHSAESPEGADQTITPAVASKIAKSK